MLSVWLPTIDLLSQEELNLPLVRTGFRVVNATGLPENIFFKVDGKMLNPKGFATGKRTGLMGLGAGNFRITADHTIKGDASLDLSLSEGNQTSVILFLEEKESKEETEAPPEKILTFYSLPSRKPGSDNPSLTIVQLTQRDVLGIKVGDINFNVERLKPQTYERPKSSVQEPSIQIRGKQLCTYNLEENQDYILVIYTAINGELDFVKFNNPP
ncbi:hypothetical protein [Phragmitibacter flavus]|uniref:hypothetical protein n=1 Tax=Phragmitibacter flavus TaxID=2576071 RepID=UPI0010FE37FB|nr:hypothetical protein [Phragmitibacter flavus]